jgi:hypothetical protein
MFLLLMANRFKISSDFPEPAYHNIRRFFKDIVDLQMGFQRLLEN